ncbi:AraC family transcriptional regulator [Microbispora sp. NPDC046973]|uniref:AraC family transcriptional regulator n=1 Tax=Microbispora sp. NPDC046973 TaxID=3155022 RepID=UPI0033D70DA4
MDALSDAIIAMHVGRPHANHHELRAPWGMRFTADRGGAFHIVLQGSCWLLPPHGAPAIRLGTGDVVFLHGAGTHGLADSPASPLTEFDLGRQGAWPSGDGELATVLCGAYLLDGGRTHPLMSEVPPVVHLPARLGRHPSLRAAVDLLADEMGRARPGAAAIVPALLDALLLYILRAWFEERAEEPAAGGWTMALADPAIAAALSAIHSAPDRQWTVAALGARAGLSRAAFAHRFATLVGQPPLTYLTWWRMTIAARLLRESDTPLHAVARQTGYSSDVAFAAAFKREHGITPGRYRAVHEQPRDSGARRGA